MRLPRVLYVGMKHDYGRPELGLSFEHWNFFHPLHHMGCDILYFDHVGLLKQHGRDAMNRRLREVARAERCDLMFTVLFEDELDKSVVRDISTESDTTTVNWFCDDHWRFEDFSRHWAPCYNWVVTTSKGALPKYQRIGYHNVVKSQWACNHYLYKHLNLPLKHDVTFIGQPHGTRRAVIDAVRAAGINVQTWGRGWENGKIEQDAMIEVFNTSRINLNLSNASVGLMTPAKRFKRAASRTLDRAGLGTVARGLWRGVKRAAPTPAPANPATNAPAKPQPQGGEQIKGRNFEVPGCGGFMLTGTSEDLDAYYHYDREIACFDSTPQLITKIQYYLAHEDERAAVARAGYERTLREHTYLHRFADIFRQTRLADIDPARLLAASAPGAVEDIT